MAYVTSASTEWVSWNDNSDITIADTSNGTTGDTTWIIWNSSSAATTDSSDMVIWASWCDSGSALTISSGVSCQPAQVSVEEQARQQRVRDERWQRRREAKVRARATLTRHLTHQQQEQLERERFFEVVTADHRRRYRIKEGRAGNVYLLDDKGREVNQYCAHPSAFVPDDDTMLAQKLMLEHDEQGFIDVANITRLRVA